MSTHSAPRSRAVFNRIARFSAYWINRSTIRRMEGLPDHVKKDIGWPPHGNLDLRDRY